MVDISLMRSMGLKKCLDGVAEGKDSKAIRSHRAVWLLNHDGEISNWDRADIRLPRLKL